MGLLAKEEIVAVLGVLDFIDMTKLAAFSFLTFNLLCAPCFAAIAAIKREMNSAKWTWFAIGYQTGFAYAVSFCIYQIGSFLIYRTNVLGAIIALGIIVAALYLLFRPARRETVAKNA